MVPKIFTRYLISENNFANTEWYLLANCKSFIDQLLSFKMQTYVLIAKKTVLVQFTSNYKTRMYSLLLC